ncbi:hypothetical protein GGQ92_001456 [Gracilibacillus halotolerans]|uniref:YheC/D like ATP-grasp n=1 Tax=Gracilibacillus halotolerans TaxID=74386 RepID=A0A841RF47_9BACI|nr:hypothetical protein [Gracilibacillus halotolerans]MBB6512670.1 hypothetical protein [Gracilibacillus halotolerans]
MYIKLKLKSYPSKKARIIVPSTIYPRFQNIHQLKRGNLSIHCEVLTHHKDDNILWISESLFQSLGMMHSSEHFIKLTHDTIDISMPIGIVLSNDYSLFQESSTNHLWIRFSQIAFLFGFTPILYSIENVHRTSEFVTGYEWENDRWVQVHVNVPNFHYLRTTLYKAYEDNINYLQANSIISNPPFLNKWYLFKSLLTNQEVSHMIHEITFSPSIQHIERRLDDYPIWLKKDSSVQQPNLLIEKADHVYMVTTEDQAYYSFPNFQALATHFFSPTHPYDIMQLAAPRINNRFAILLYKDSASNWKCLFLTKRYTSFPPSVSLEKKIEATATRLAQIIEENSNTNLIELGLVFSVENESMLWLEDIQLQPNWESHLSHPSRKTESIQFFSELLNSITTRWNETMPST